jgi:hydroxymethylpyrimidine pyrophosphatase-like HAD family hydrolase
MTDVDGTLTAADDSVSPMATEAMPLLESTGINVGLVSGRTFSRLQSLALQTGISGPIIAENGGLASLSPDSELVDLGYSRQPALEALSKLQGLFPGAIRGREDNAERLIDVVFFSGSVTDDELRKHLDEVQLLDSGFIRHLMMPGISKGKTLMRLLTEMDNINLLPEEVLVIGDSATDLSLFELFPNSVLVPNPRLSAAQTDRLSAAVRFISELSFGEGFAQVAHHIVNSRT